MTNSTTTGEQEWQGGGTDQRRYTTNQLREQLAAERHKREACEVLIRDLQKQLAAEREGGRWRIISEQLKAQLDTAVEALEKIGGGK